MARSHDAQDMDYTQDTSTLEKEHFLVTTIVA